MRDTVAQRPKMLGDRLGLGNSVFLRQRLNEAKIERARCGLVESQAFREVILDGPLDAADLHRNL